MSALLLILTALLALAFVFAGGSKLFRSRAILLADPRMAWAADFSTTQIKLIGLAEVLGGLGLIAPLALGIQPLLSPVAAAALALLMAGAVVTHLRRRENPAAPAVLAMLCVVSIALFRAAA